MILPPFVITLRRGGICAFFIALYGICVKIM